MRSGGRNIQEKNSNDEEVSHLCRREQNGLLWRARSRARVRANDGWITLSGEVDWQYQKRAATECVRHLSVVIACRCPKAGCARVLRGDSTELPRSDPREC